MNSVGMSELRSFAVLLVSPSAYRIDGTFRYAAEELPEIGQLIAVEDDLGGPERKAWVERVDPGERFPIHATDATQPLPERSIRPHVRLWRDSVAHHGHGRRGWLARHRRRAR
jgi:hypothetical protein